MAEDHDSPDMGKGPGWKAVPVWGIVVSLVWLTVVSIVALGLLAAIWPHPTPGGTVPKTETAPATDTAKQTTDTSKPATDTAKPATDTAKPATDTAKPATDTAKPAAGTAKPATDTAKPATDTAGGGAKKPEEKDCKPDQQPECDCWDRVEATRLKYYKGDVKAAQAANDPSCVYIWLPWPLSYLSISGWHVLWSETRLLLIIMICGFLGAMIYALRSILWYVGHRSLLWSWLATYIVIPIVGSLMAVVFYLALRGGLFSSTTTVADTSPFGFAGIAALVGMFIQQSAEKLKTVFEAILTSLKAGGDTVKTEPPKAVTVPHAANASVTINGDNFTAATTASIGSIALATTLVSAKQLTVVVPTQLQNAGNKVTITIKNPNMSVDVTAT